MGALAGAKSQNKYLRRPLVAVRGGRITHIVQAYHAGHGNRIRHYQVNLNVFWCCKLRPVWRTQLRWTVDGDGVIPWAAHVPGCPASF
jgi:hypothetical protein